MVPLGGSRYHQADKKDHQPRQERLCWSDAIAEPAADHRGEQHPDQEQRECPGVVIEAVEIASGYWHCGGHRDGLEGDGNDRRAKTNRERTLGDPRRRFGSRAGGLLGRHSNSPPLQADSRSIRGVTV
jgi:hypothetical protein